MRRYKVYAGKESVEQYDYWHFGGSGGQHVLQKNPAALQFLMGTRKGLLLDIPRGTAVFLALKAENHRDSR